MSDMYVEIVFADRYLLRLLHIYEDAGCHLDQFKYVPTTLSVQIHVNRISIVVVCRCT